MAQLQPLARRKTAEIEFGAMRQRRMILPCGHIGDNRAEHKKKPLGQSRAVSEFCVSLREAERQPSGVEGKVRRIGLKFRLADTCQANGIAAHGIGDQRPSGGVSRVAQNVRHIGEIRRG